MSADSGAMLIQHGLARPAGWIDWASADGEGWRLGGWALLPDRGTFDAIRVRWRGHELGLATSVERPDLDEAAYWIRGARRGGFSLRVPERDADGRLELICEREGRPVAALSTIFVASQLEAVELPPRSLAERVSDLSGDAFRLSGLKAFTDLWDQISQYRPDPCALRILDWGCGCGRIARYLARAGVTELLGCDIDAEAVAWCSQNLEGHFSRCAPEPPLPFGDGAVDVVCASSVFTHLGRADQQRWLRELRRIISPDGLLLASVAGEYAISLSTSRLLRPGQRAGSLVGRAVAFRKRSMLRRAGIIDHYLDDHFDGIAPPGYYKLVYQTQTFTERAWTEEFEVTAYVERGLSGHQDLVVMRPRPST